MALRWGIVSAGKISNDFVNAVQTLPRTDHQIVAVGARSESSALEFAKTHDIPKSYGGYDRIAKDSEIDIVYVGNLNPQHFEVSKMMLEHGKHVLCEKPLTMNENQTRKLVEIAKEKKKFLKEAIWSRSFPAYVELKKILNSGIIGRIFQVNVSLGSDLQHVERLKKKEMGGGTILDLGVFVLQFQQLVFKGETPNKMVALGGLNREGTDDYVSSIWSYSGDRISCLSTSAKTNYPNEAVIIGTKRIIKVPNFWCPTSIITPERSYGFKLPESDAFFNFYNSVGLCYQAEHVRKCILAGKIESPNVTHQESIQLAHHMDLLRKEVGVVFPEDRVLLSKVL